MKSFKTIKRKIKKKIWFRFTGWFRARWFDTKLKFYDLTNALRMFWHCLKGRAVVPTTSWRMADQDELILTGSFGMLCNLLHHEAEIDWFCENIDLKKAGKPVIPYKEFIKRRDEWVFKHLDWEATLDDPNLEDWQQNPKQAEAGRIQKELYIWWTQTRPNRPPLYSFRNSFEVEQDRYEEDTAQLQRLVSIRAALWV